VFLRINKIEQEWPAAISVFSLVEKNSPAAIPLNPPIVGLVTVPPFSVSKKKIDIPDN